MKVLCKILGLGDRYPASDGSVITRQTMEEYLNSEIYQKTIEQKTMISSLTHRCRNLNSVFPDKPALKQTIGKDDSILIVNNDAPTPTHVVTKLFIGDDDWLYGEIEIFDPELFDNIAKENIKRLLGLLRSGCKVHTSAVVIAYWSQQKNGVDLCKKIQEIRGVDVTMNSSWKDSHIIEILEDENYEEEIKNFSNVDAIVDYEGKEGIVRAKCFSDFTGLDVNIPKSSKIDGRFTTLKAKSFSSINPITVENEVICSTPGVQDTVVEKTFSPAQVNERIRLSKMSPRLRMRRLVLDYRQALKQQGGVEKISPESLKIMKSLFAQDLLGILQELTPQVVDSGKNLNALLGASSLGVEVRKATQKLQIPFRLALMESKKSGFVSKNRYQKIQEAYNEFVKAVLDYVFETPTNQKLKEEEEEENGQN